LDKPRARALLGEKDRTVDVLILLRPFDHSHALPPSLPFPRSLALSLRPYAAAANPTPSEAAKAAAAARPPVPTAPKVREREQRCPREGIKCRESTHILTPFTHFAHYHIHTHTHTHTHRQLPPPPPWRSRACRTSRRSASSTCWQGTASAREPPATTASAACGPFARRAKGEFFDGGGGDRC
jgi:hypothetical protein